MRLFAALALVGLAAACAAPQDMTMQGLAGPGNTAALNAAVACRLDDALALAQGASNTPRPSERLFSQFAQAAILTELGRTGEAAAAIDVATADPQMNPEGAPRAEMQAAADALAQTIGRQRQAATGSAEC